MKIYDYKGKKNICGQRLKEARKEFKMTQEKLSIILQNYGITIERDSISRIEIGTRFVTDYELICNDLLSRETYRESPQVLFNCSEGTLKEPRVISSRHWPL